MGAVGPLGNIDVVCFDFWNTLVREAGAGALVAARIPMVAEALHSAGHAFSEERLRAAHAVAQAAFEEAWAANEQFRIDRACALIGTELELDSALTALIEEAFAEGGRTAAVVVVDGAREAVLAARARGARTAIVCDIGLTPSAVLLDWLKEHELFEAFDCLAFSDRIGRYKPDPAMFDWVLDKFGQTDPSIAVHVGDRRRTDVEGARRRGMRSVRFRGVYDDTSELPDADHVIDSLLELEQALWPA